MQRFQEVLFDNDPNILPFMRTDDELINHLEVFDMPLDRRWRGVYSFEELCVLWRTVATLPTSMSSHSLGCWLAKLWDVILDTLLMPAPLAKRRKLLRQGMRAIESTMSVLLQKRYSGAVCPTCSKQLWQCMHHPTRTGVCCFDVRLTRLTMSQLLHVLNFY